MAEANHKKKQWNDDKFIKEEKQNIFLWSCSNALKKTPAREETSLKMHQVISQQIESH